MRRAQVFSAVFGHVAEQGLENLTLDRVAARAGVSKGVVAYYFKNKKNLLLESFRAFLESYNQEIISRIQPGMPARDLLNLVVEATLNPGKAGVAPLGSSSPEKEFVPETAEPAPPLEQYPKVMLHFLHKAMLDQEFREIIQEIYGLYLGSMVKVIEYGVESKEFAPLDARKAAYGLFALLDGILIHWAMGYRPLDLNESLEICRDYIRNLKPGTAREGAG